MIVSFSATLKMLRESKKMSQPQLAARIGVSRSMVSLYENGSRLPSFETLLRIARVFHVSTDYLLGVESVGHTLDAKDLTPSQYQAVLEIIEQFRIANGQENP